MSALSDLPKGWSIIDAETFCTKVADGTHDSPKRVLKGRKLVTSKNIISGELDLNSCYFISESDFNEVNKRSKVDRNDVLLSMIGTVGESCFIDDDPNFAIKNVGLLKNNSRDKGLWLHFYFTSPVAQRLIKERLRGTTQQYLTLGEIRKFPIPLPPSQSDIAKIVLVLSELRKKIALNKKMNATLEAMAQALFKSWFVDFDPVKAKLAAVRCGRDPEKAAMAAIACKLVVPPGKPKPDNFKDKLPSADAIDAAIASLDALSEEQMRSLKEKAAHFPSDFIESELGLIPQGWKISSLEKHSNFKNGYAFKAKDWKNSGFPVVKIGSVKPGIVDVDLCSYISKETSFGLDDYILKEGDILIGMTGYPGETGLVPRYHKDIYLNQRVGRFSAPNEHLENYSWIYCVVRDFKFRKYVEINSHGSAQANISGRALLEYKIVWPGNSLIKFFSSSTLMNMKKITVNEYESRKLTHIRDTLLPKLLSGEISVASV